MLRALSIVSRAGLAASVAALLLALARSRPLYAESPFDVSAAPAAAAALGCGVVAALCGGDRAARRWRTIAAVLASLLALLAAVVGLRGAGGLAATVSDGGVVLGRTANGPIDLIGRDLRELAPRRATLDWSGELRLPHPGRYAFWIEGLGSASASVAGRPLLAASGSPFRSEAALVVGAGPTPLLVHFEQHGAGPRVRFGWTRPDGRREIVPPRHLGPSRGSGWWRLTDLLTVAASLLAGLLVFLAPWDAPRRPSAASGVGGRELALASLAYLALVAVMSWPLVRDLAHTGPLYRPDGRLNTWILGWTGHAIWREPTRLFQAPDFYPLPDTLAFSENLLLPAAFAAPFAALAGPVFGYNVVLLASLIASGLASYLLVRRAGGDRLAAFVGGAYFAVGPQRWTRLTHIQAQVTLFLPLALLALDRFWERRTLRRALLVGLMLALQGLSSVYLGVITGAVLAVAAAIGVCGGLRPRELGRLAVGFVLAGLLLLPAAWPYFRTRAFLGQEFSMADVSGAATNLVSYAAAGTALWGPLTQRQLGMERLTDTLFPGVVVLLLAVVGLAKAPRRYRAVALGASVMAVFFSLGPETALYRWLHEHVVIVRVVRVLSRFAIVPALALSVLAGLALSGRRRLVCGLALALMLAESANLPLRLERYDGPSPASRWLAGQPGAVAYLPLSDDNSREMLDSLVHLRPLVNGEGAFVPRPFDRALEMLGGASVDEEALRFLRGIGVRQLVARHELPLRQLAAFGEERVYEVSAGPAATEVIPGIPVASVWTSAGATIDLGLPRRVSGVVFELDDREWRAQPRVWASADGVSWQPLAAQASLADAALSLYREPRHARGELRFAPLTTRFLRLDPELPARRGILESRP